MFTTKHLRCILGNEPLSFKLPGEIFDNWTLHSKSGKKIPFDLHIMVFPDDRKKNYWDHKVLVNGIDQRNLNPGSEIYDAWIKTPKDKNHIWFKFMFDWRCLLNLDNKDLEYGVNILGDYLKNPKYYWLKYEMIGENGLKIRKKKGGRKKHPKTPNINFKHTYTNRPPFEHVPYYLAYVRDVVTGAVERVSREEAEHLIDKHEHLEYCKKKHWRSYQKSQLPKYPVVEKSIYWNEKAEEKIVYGTNKKGEEQATLNCYLPKVLKYKGNTRKDRRDWKHKKELKHRKYGDMYQKHQTMMFLPKYEKEVYVKDKHLKEFTIRKKHKVEIISPKEVRWIEQEGSKKKLKIVKKAEFKESIEVVTKPNPRFKKAVKKLDLTKSKIATNKYQIRTIEFDYEYVPMTFSSKKQPEIQTFLWEDGSPKMKKIYKGKREATVTIIEHPRTTYKTIITRQYPPVITRKRSIVKKNIEFLKKQQQEEQSKKAE